MPTPSSFLAARWMLCVVMAGLPPAHLHLHLHHVWREATHAELVAGVVVWLLVAGPVLVLVLVQRLCLVMVVERGASAVEMEVPLTTTGCLPRLQPPCIAAARMCGVSTAVVHTAPWLSGTLWCSAHPAALPWTLVPTGTPVLWGHLPPVVRQQPPCSPPLRPWPPSLPAAMQLPCPGHVCAAALLQRVVPLCGTHPRSPPPAGPWWTCV